MHLITFVTQLSKSHLYSCMYAYIHGFKHHDKNHVVKVRLSERVRLFVVHVNDDIL